MGYPEKIIFPKEGGQFILTGDQTLFQLYIIDNDSNEYWDAENLNDERDTLMVSFDWLTVQMPERSQTLIITAEPLTEKKSRELRIEGYTGPSYTRIKVVQKYK